MSRPNEEMVRKTTKKRRKKRKVRLLGGFILFLIIALVVTAALSLTVLFPVKVVTASGSELYTQEQIVKISGITSENNLFVLSQELVAENLHKGLPYIEDVKLVRKIPDTIHIEVTDAKEFACYKIEDVYYVVSDKGAVLNSYSEIPENTFEIICPTAKCTVGNMVEFEKDNVSQALINKVIEYLTDEEIKINKIDVTDRYNIKANIDDRFEVIFGGEENLDRKTAHLRGMIQAIEPDRSGTINLSMWTSEKSEGSFTPNKIQ